MEPEPALVWATGVIVLNSVAFEEAMMPVVHLDWEVNHDLIFRLREDDSRAMLEVDKLCRFKHGVDGLEIQVVWIVRESEFFGH